MELDPKKIPKSVQIAAGWVMNAYKKFGEGKITLEQLSEIINAKVEDMDVLQKDINEEANKKRGGNE